MSDKQQATNNGVGFSGLLFLVLMTLKLTGHISASWLWVSAPLWLPLAIAVCFLALLGTAALALAACDWVGSNCKRRGSGGRLR